MFMHLFQDGVKAAQADVAQQKELLKARNKDINAAAAEQRGLQKEASNGQLKIQESQHKITKLQKDSQEAGRQV